MSFRLASPHAGFGRPAIDPARPLTFRLDGIAYAGFEGDTVLSAVLAAGTLCAGAVDGAPLRLGLDFAPLVGAAGARETAGVPMALCPARDGLDLVTLGRKSGTLARLAARLTRRPPASLHLAFARIAGDAPLADLTPTESDVVVVGGGVAGMAAALEAARRGQRVTLVEARGRLGGDASLFGNREGEPAVLETIARLTAEVAATPAIALRLLCRAVDAAPGAVVVSRVVVDAAGPSLVRERLAAPRIVLATGCADRLSVFPGNRLPGIFGVAEAFELAGAYHVWPRGPTLFAGGVNALYHLALMAKDSGAGVVRLVDHRLAPHSRFADFAKASGIVQEFGTRVAGVASGGRAGLVVATTLAWYDSRSEGNALFAPGSVVTSDGWQPRLDLWTRLGGRLVWDGRNAVAGGDLVASGVALAGSVAGTETTAGTRASGERAMAALFGEPVEPVVEERLDDYIETTDAPPLRTLFSAEQPAFASGGTVLLALPESADKEPGKRFGRLVALRPDLGGAGELDADALGALTRAGLTPADRFEAIAVERLARPDIVVAAPAPPDAPTGAVDAVPAYLAGRFGSDAAQRVLVSEDGRGFEPGMLVFADSGQRRPDQVVGVVLLARPDGGVALVASPTLAVAARLSVRDGGRAIAARIEDMAGA